MHISNENKAAIEFLAKKLDLDEAQYSRLLELILTVVEDEIDRALLNAGVQ